MSEGEQGGSEAVGPLSTHRLRTALQHDSPPRVRLPHSAFAAGPSFHTPEGSNAQPAALALSLALYALCNACKLVHHVQMPCT